MIRRPPRSTPLYSSAASDVYKRQFSVPRCAPRLGAEEAVLLGKSPLVAVVDEAIEGCPRLGHRATQAAADPLFEGLEESARPRRCSVPGTGAVKTLHQSNLAEELLKAPFIRMAREGPLPARLPNAVPSLRVLPIEPSLLEQLMTVAPHEDFFVWLEHLREFIGIVRQVQGAAHGRFKLAKVKMLQDRSAWVVMIENLKEA